MFKNFWALLYERLKKLLSRVEMSAFTLSRYSRWTTTAAAPRTRTVKRPCQQWQLQGRRNRQRQQLHQPLTTVVKCASWRHVLASHWCRADMRGSLNLVLCACHIWLRDALFVVRILLLKCEFFLYDKLCRSTLATFSLIICYFYAVSLLCFVQKNIKHVNGIQ